MTGASLRRVGVLAGSHALLAAATVVLAVLAMHALLALAPGDAIDLLPDSASVRPALEAQFGLDAPWHEQVMNTLTGQLGVSLSLRPGAPVRALIGGPLAYSASVWAVAGVALTVLATGLAVARTRWTRPVSIGLSALSIVPVFLLAHLCVDAIDTPTFAAMNAGYIGRPSWFPLPLEPSPLRFALAVSVLAIASGTFADGFTELSARVQTLRRSPFAQAARSRDEPEWTWLWRHLAVAVCELIAGRGPVLLGGLVILEKVLLLNGAGSLLWDAAIARDAPVALALTAVFAVWVAVLRAVTTTARDVLLRGQPA